MDRAPQNERRDLIRRCLATGYDQAALAGDHVVAGLPPEDRELRLAAVLVPLVEHGPGMTVLLTRRTERLVHHAGQISFPGGGLEAGDSGPVAAALREATEEIGLRPERVEIAGQLERYQTVTGFLVTPVVGFVRPPLALQPNPEEVAEIFEVPLDFILDRHNHLRRSRVFRGQRRHFFVLPYRDYYIWGATAAILITLAHRLQPAVHNG